MSYVFSSEFTFQVISPCFFIDCGLQSPTTKGVEQSLNNFLHVS